MADSSPRWTVTGQREDMQVGPAGTFVPGVVVSFRTTSGATGSVFVPHESYTVDKVRQLIDARAEVMEGVAGLEG